MKKILIIEDNEDIRENLAEILELAGYEAIVAENGKTGVELAEKNVPDLVLCDVMMPVLDGYGVLKILNGKPKTADIPFIFLTAKTEKSDFRYGMNLGADDYITKPFESNELLQVIELRLKKSEKLTKSFAESKDIHAFINEAKGLEALQHLADDRETRHFSKKSEIYTEGAIPRYLYFIQKGKVKFFKTNEDGKELILNILGEKELFGHTALLRGGNYTESASMLEEGDLVLIPKDDFFALVHNNRDVAARFIKILAGNIAEQEQQLIDLAYNSVRKRVADALVKLAEKYQSQPIAMLREDIAAIAGTAKETVIRTLTDFKDEKLIDIEDGKISVLKLEKLRTLYN